MRIGLQLGLALLGTIALLPGQTSAPASNEPLHVLAGKSVLINSPARFTRVLVSNPAVLDALVTNPAQLVVEAKVPGSSSLVLWDETGRSRLMDVTVDVDVAGLRQAIHNAYPAAAIQTQADGARILLSGVAPDQAAADGLVKIANVYSPQVVNSLRLAPVVAAREREVMLEVRFAEVDRTRLDQFAVNLLSTGAGNTPGATSTQQFGAPGGANNSPLTLTGVIPGGLGGTTTSFGVDNLLNIFLFRPDLNLGATISNLEQKDILQILAQPNLMALSGQKASFLAGGQFPVPVVQGGTAVGAVTIQFRPYGVQLDFTGTVLPDNSIRLQVDPEVSTLDYSNAVSISGFTIPAISTRSASTTVELLDGQSFGIAGLLDQRVTAQLSRMPGISSVPILGQLFNSHNNQRSRTELLVMVTPHIVDPLHGTASAAEPKLAMPYLDSGSYDKGLPGAKPAGTGNGKGGGQ